MESRYALLETRMGWLGILGSPTGLRHLVLPQSSPGKVLSLLGEGIYEADPDIASFGDLPDRLVEYFKGEMVSFPDLIDLAGATPFQCTVWQVTRSISHGQTRSYGWIARQIGIPGGARAVGQALARNPLPVIVPCHRVIGAAGRRLTGFSYGLEMKRRMLQMEAAGIIKL
jgi:methylated-DNA-[protein]-cysteine S-methyltransferase